MTFSGGQGWARAAVRRLLDSRLLRSVAQISLGSAIVTAIQLVTSILTARWVAPRDMGVWNAVSIVSVYAPFAGLGVVNGLSRELPYLIGQKRVDEARLAAGATLGLAVVLAVATALGTVAAVGWLWAQGRLQLTAAVAAVGVSVMCSWWVGYVGTTYRGHVEFGRLAAANSLNAFAGLLLMVLVWRFGFSGMLTRVAVSALLGALILYYWRPLRVAPSWGLPQLVKLARVGVPIMMVGQLGAVFLALDRTVLLDSREALGYYTLAMQAMIAAQVIPSAFAAVAYPTMAQRYGETHRAGDLLRLAAKTAAATSALAACVGVLGWVAAPAVVSWVLPRYLPGVRAAQWACFAGLAVGAYAFAIIFNVIKRQDLYVVCWALGAGTFWLTWSWLTGSPSADRTTCAAQAMVAASFVLFTSCVPVSWLACRAHDRRRDLAAARGAAARA